DVQLVPFKGSAEIGQAVLAGKGAFALDSTGSSLPLIQAGQYRALAKYSNRPPAILPHVPPLPPAADLPGLDDSSTWVARVAAAGRFAAAEKKPTRKVEALTPEAAMSPKWKKGGFPTTASSTPAEFDAFIRSETERWSKVLKDSGNIKLD